MTYRRPAIDLRPGMAATAIGALLALSGCGTSTGQGGGAPPAAPVDVAAAVERSLPDVEEFTGRLEAADLVQVRPRVAGTVEQVHVVDGAGVKRGALLFTIDPRPYQAEVARTEAGLATARAQTRLADQELKRVTTLFAQQAVAQEEAEQAAASEETARAAVLQAEAALRTARLNLEHTSVRAPVAGRVSRIEITRGNLVNDSDVLTTLVGSGKVYTYFNVSEQIYLRLRKAPAVQREVLMGLVDEDRPTHEGLVDFIDNRLNPQSATIRVRASFANADGQLVPGMFTRIRVNASAPRPVVLVPDRAVGTDQDRKFVWVVGPDNLPKPRPVTLGALVDGMRVLETGVRAGEKIVVAGVQRVRPGAPVAPNPVTLDERGVPVPTATSGAAAAGPG